MTRILGWFFDAVMKRSLAAFQEGLNRPFAIQEEALRRILAANANTEFGRKHGFARLLQVPGADIWKHFRKTVPIRSYTDFQPDIERMKNGEAGILIPGKPEMFSLTSGTTSEPKFCPVNRAFIKEHHRQHLLWMYHVYKHHPLTNTGKYLVAASPAEMGRTAGGIPYGAMSGKQLETQSIPVRRRQAVPVQAQRLESADDRWFNLLLFALAEEDLRVVTAVNPSTLVALANRLDRDADTLLDHLAKGHPAAGDAKASSSAAALAKAFRPNPERARKLREIVKSEGSLSPASAWPNLEILLTWQGGSSAFYLPHVSTLWGGTAQRCLGLRASEGTFSIPLEDATASGTLAVGGHAMEFTPADAGDPKLDSPTLLPGELEEGGLYRLIATTSGGFCRYDMADLVRVTGYNKKTPIVAFERRAGSVLSATGEKITEDQAVAAMEVAASGGPLLNGFTVTWEMDGETTRYVVAVECAGDEDGYRSRRGLMRDRLRQILAVFDDELMRRNCEYLSKREDDRLAFPRLVILARGSYEALRAALAASGRPENQVKQPILVPPPGPGKAPVKGDGFFDRVRIVEEL